jgi:hypothetical protein
MKLTNKRLGNTLRILDDIIKEYKEETPEKKRDWRTYEQRYSQRLKTAFRELRPLVEEAVSTLQIQNGETRGAKAKLTVEQKVLLLLLKHLFKESNRRMSVMFMVFSLLTDIDVSYKTVERLYSDEKVILALHNLHELILKKKGSEEQTVRGMELDIPSQ